MNNSRILQISVILCSSLALSGCTNLRNALRPTRVSPPAWAIDNCAPTRSPRSAPTRPRSGFGVVKRGDLVVHAMSLRVFSRPELKVRT